MKINKVSGFVLTAVVGIVALVGILAVSVFSLGNFKGDIRSSAQVLSSTATLAIQSSSDVANEDGSEVKVGGSSIWLGNGQSTSTSYLGLRFQGDTIPKGAQINSAKIEFTPNSTQWIGVKTRFSGENSLSPESFSSSNKPSSRGLTSTSKDSNDNSQWEKDKTYSQDVTTVVQELVNAEGRSTIAFIVKGTGVQWGRKFIYGSPSSGKQPKLVVSYTSSSGGTTPTQTPSASPVATSTSRPSATATATTSPTSQATAMPTNMPMATATPNSSSVPQGGFGVSNDSNKEAGINLAKFNQVKADVSSGMYERPCTAEEHDPTKWHTLINEVAKCHYNHQHGDDPNYVNDIFGAPGDWFGKAGQSISYPWQTFVMPEGVDRNYVNTNPAQQENGFKHEGYGWVVRRNQDCPTRQPDNSGNPLIRPMGACITDFRLQYHAHGMMDTPVRFHSTSVEMRVCLDKSDPSSCGFYRTGGWTDFGRLFTTDNDVSCRENVAAIFIPIAGETRFGSIRIPSERSEIRCHPTVTNLGNFPRQSTPMAEWWSFMANGSFAQLRYQLRFYNPIGNVNRTNPAITSSFCSPTDTDCRFNQSIVSVFMGYVIPISGGNVNGKRVTYTSRWGSPNRNCTAPGVDCVPTTLENVKMNLDYNGDGRVEDARFFHTVCNNCQKTDYDISPVGKQWITWFYH